MGSVRGAAVLLALVLLSAGCSERLTPARAGTVIRHSKAFLSGAPASDPVFDAISSLRVESAYGETGDSCVAEFSYHWPPDPRARNGGSLSPELTARVYLRRYGGSWSVDDARSRTLVPSWPRLPRTSNPFSDGGSEPSAAGFPLTATAAGSPTPCAVTRPAGDVRATSDCPGDYGNAGLLVGLQPEIVFRPGGAGFVLPDGSLAWKFGWCRRARGKLSVRGRRLDGGSPPARADIGPDNGEPGFVPMHLIFPTPGCWQITGEAGGSSVTFVTHVVDHRKGSQP